MARETAQDLRRELRRRLEAELEKIERKVHRPQSDHGISFRDSTVLERALEPRALEAPPPLPPELSRWLFLHEARLLHPEILEDLRHDVLHRARGKDRTEALLDWLEKYWLLELSILSESEQTLCWWEAREARGSGEGSRRQRLPVKVRLRWGFELEIASERAARFKAARVARLQRAGAKPSTADLLHVALKGTYTVGFDPPRKITWERGKESADDFADRLESAAGDLLKVARLLRAQARAIDSYSAFRHFRKTATRYHYRWLVEKQIEGRSYSKLTRGPGQSLEAARNATQRLADRIGLTLRPAL